MSIKFQLIEGWKHAHRLWVVRVLLAGFVSGAVAGTAVYSSLADYWPPLLAIGAAMLVCAAGILARILKQPPKGDAS